MIKAVLLDLDDTLLHTQTQRFVEHYVAGLADQIAQRIPSLAGSPATVRQAISRATRVVLGNLDPTRTNAQVFSEALVEVLDLPDDISPALLEVFGQAASLQSAEIVNEIPVARTLIDRLFDLGLTVVIATNAVFPLDAVMMRMAWAGIDSPRLPYALITHIDAMHFAKPNPHYYEEILARVGVEADEAIMVGDSFPQDMIPAGQAGLNTFWIDWGASHDPSEIVPDGAGTLDDFDQLVANGWLETLKPRPRTAAQIAQRMLGSVGALFGLVGGLPAANWHVRPDPEEWSPFENVRHLRESERTVQRPRLQRILAENNPFISQPQDSPDLGVRDASTEDGYTVLREFWDERCRTLAFIQSLREEDWNRPARHSIFGPTTLLEMAHFTTRHDHLHLNQLVQTLNK